MCYLVWLAAVGVLSFVPGPNAQASAQPPTAVPQKAVYLTFDDGPDPYYTPKILAILRSEHVPATFFVLGYRAEHYPQLVRRTYEEGHEIGNHGYYHTFIVHKSNDWVRDDISKTDQIVQTICGERPKFFRPPGGILSKSDSGLVFRTGHPIAMWTVDTEDWKGAPARAIERSVLTHAAPNSIILMHDGVPTHAIEALPVIIHELRSRGYAFEVLPKRFQGPSVGGATDSHNYRFKVH